MYAVFIFCDEQSRSTCYLENCQIAVVLCSSWKTTFQRQNQIFCSLEKFILSNCHTEKALLHLLLGYTIQMNSVKLKKLKEDIKDRSVNRVRDVPCITGVYIVQWKRLLQQVLFAVQFQGNVGKPVWFCLPSQILSSEEVPQHFYECSKKNETVLDFECGLL